VIAVNRYITMFTAGKLVKYINHLAKKFFLIEVYIYLSFALRAMTILKYNKTVKNIFFTIMHKIITK